MPVLTCYTLVQGSAYQGEVLRTLRNLQPVFLEGFTEDALLSRVQGEYPNSLDTACLCTFAAEGLLPRRHTMCVYVRRKM